MGETMQEAAWKPLPIAGFLHADIALQNFLDVDPQLQLCEASTNAAMHTKAKADMAARILARHIKDFCIVKQSLVAIARDIPQHDFLALADHLPIKLIILRRRAPHMRHRRLPADNLACRIGDQIGLIVQQVELVGEVVKGINQPRHGIARGVIPANDQQSDIAHPFSGRHIAHRL